MSEGSSSYSVKITGGVDLSVLHSLDQLKESILGVQSKISGLITEATELFGAYELVKFALEAVKATAELHRFSEEVGIGVEELSKLKFAADMTDAGEHFRQAMLKLSLNIAEASDKGSKAARIFQAIGFDLDQLQHQSTDETFKQLADKFAGWENGAGKAAIAMELLGSRNAALIKLLSEGREGIDAYGNQLDQVGGVVTKEAAEKAHQFEQAMTLLKATANGVALTIGSELVPAITEFIRNALQALTGSGDWKTALATLGDIAHRAALSFGFLNATVGDAIDRMMTLFSVLNTLASNKFIRANMGLFGLFLPESESPDTITGALTKALDQISQAGERSANRWSNAIDKLQQAMGLSSKVSGEASHAGNGESSRSLTKPPSIFGDEQDVKNSITALQEDLRAEQEIFSLRKAMVAADFSKTDYEKRAEDLEILKQEVSALDDYLKSLQAIYAIETDPKSRDALQKAFDQGLKQRNQLSARGVGLGGQPDANSISEQITASMTKLRQQFGTVAQNIANGFTSVIGNAVNSVSQGITSLIMGTKTWAQALTEIGTSILTSIVQAIVQMGVRWVATQLMMAAAGKAIMAGTTAAAAPIASAQSAIWATPATLATIASYGSAAAAAPGFIAASEAETMAISMGGSFAEGGFTGMIPPDKIAGVVHGQEYVMPADMTSRYFGVLEQMRSGNYPSGPGRTGRNGGAGSGGNVNVGFLNTRQDEREFQRREGYKITVDQLRKRGAKIPI